MELKYSLGRNIGNLSRLAIGSRLGNSLVNILETTRANRFKTVNVQIEIAYLYAARVRVDTNLV